jgi:hypothetical protein
VFTNLDGAFDPEEIFFVGTQTARLGMRKARRSSVEARAGARHLDVSSEMH